MYIVYSCIYLFNNDLIIQYHVIALLYVAFSIITILPFYFFTLDFTIWIHCFCFPIASTSASNKDPEVIYFFILGCSGSLHATLLLLTWFVRSQRVMLFFRPWCKSIFWLYDFLFVSFSFGKVIFFVTNYILMCFSTSNISLIHEMISNICKTFNNLKQGRKWWTG